MTRMHADFNLDGTVTERPYTAEENAAADALEATWAAELVRLEKLGQIEALEAMITPRRMREAVLGLEGAAEWLADQEDAIAVLREQLAEL